MDPIPYLYISNTHSYLLIERSSSNTGLCLFLFEEFLISKAASHKHPPHTTIREGAVRLLNQSSRGFIATFILKETEEPLVNRSPTHIQKAVANQFISNRAERTFGTSVGRAL